MTLSAVIVTHNSSHVLEACWCSVRTLLPGAEIVVVDNASTDDTKRLAEELEGVILVANATNGGFGRACNQGAEFAHGSHVLFLNPDIQIAEVDVPALERELESSPFGLVAPIIEPGTRGGSLARHWAVDLMHHVANPLRPRELPVLPRAVLPKREWWLSGASLLLERGEFARIGGFDRRFFLFYEDVDLARRYRAAGLPVRITPSIRALHGEGVSSAGNGARVAMRRGWSYLGWIEYLATWNGPVTAVRAAKTARLLRTQVDRILALLQRAGPLAYRASAKRSELAELERFIQWQCSLADGTAPADFCPQAREIVAGLSA